ncbi:DUF192 domain-containing protein [Falsiroseomonas selenitidurans]|uniref:DUF192 domain-containing protein n=1 Tax=Falsiroseomonas selenitidurans TaxID=2716335 RepID=A0ABX1DZ29_9PROT|nr:DUF192 domain-containing protein [Falsiroseomonas selenitidurans]NKC30167.1 DUF192 domain-containing protein [Falsiroseomonas selenitidurans]OYW07905.1 MAG: hypothetical protein B7Z53_05535 [Rhodospirillales bacterium 12-71-4]
MITRRPLFAALGLLFASAARAQPGVDRPQPRLPTERLVIVGRDGTRHEFQVEMAVSPDHQMIGLMFRPTVAAQEGMLFDWGSPRESSMWMRNTIAPLDMVFIAADGRIHRIAERTVPYSLTPVDSRGPVRATLELQAGITERLDIRVGDRVLHPIFGTAP